MSYKWLLSFVDDNNLKGLSTQDVVTQIVIPATKEKKSRYVDLIPESDVSLPTFFASYKNVFIYKLILSSHVWSAPFLDLIDSLKEYIGKKPKEDVFVWIDIFAVNQHRDSGCQGTDLQGLSVALKHSKETILCIDQNLKLLTRLEHWVRKRFSNS